MLAKRERQVRKAHDEFDQLAHSIESDLLAQQQAILQVLEFGDDAIEKARHDIATRIEETKIRSPLR